MVTQPIPDRPPRIAFVTGSVAVGGATTFLCNLGGELVRRGVPVEVLSLESAHPLAADFKSRGVPVVCLDEKLLIFEDRILAVLKELARFQPTVVVANMSAGSFEVLRYLPNGVFRAGVCHTDHAREYATAKPFAGLLDLLVAVSETVRAKAHAMPEFAKVPVRCLPLGVPMPEIPRPARGPEEPLRIIYLGRLGREQKRVHLFPEIFGHLKASGIPFHWTIAGEGPELEFVKNNLPSNPPHQTVTFEGGVPYSAVPRLLSEHDVFLLTSDYEGLPLVLLEAMGAGLVPVVSDLPSGIRELVDDTTGRRVAPDNLKGYADAIVRLHEQRDVLTRLSRAAREKVRVNYSVPAMADRWLGAFPPPPKTAIEWPRSWSVKPPLATSSPWRFSPPARVLRRQLLKWRQASANN